MKYQVPQFIELEDKVLGPFSFKQFLYLAGGAGFAYVVYRFVPNFYLAILLIAPILATSLALAFYKVHSRPFIDVMQSALLFISGAKLYIWKKGNKEIGDTIPTFGGTINNKENKFVATGKLTNLSREIDLPQKNTTGDE